MERKNIVFLDEGRGIGGAEINLINILRFLDKNSFYPHVILSCRNKFYTLMDESKIEITVLSTPPFLSTSFEFGTIRIFNFFSILYDVLLILYKSLKLYIFLLTNNNISILQTCGVFEHIYGGMAARLAGIPCVWHLQDIPSENFLFGLGRFFLNFCGIILPKKIIVISEGVKEIFCDSLQKKVVIIHNGIDMSKFKIRKIDSFQKTKKKLRIEDSEIVIGMTSRIVPWKGHKVFLQAAKVITEKFSNTKFIIAGDTTFGKRSYLYELKELAKKLGIQNKIIFAGFVENIEDILGVIDILVHCSIRPEPFGLDIIEAMACGKPVIATNIGAPKEIIENNIDGILVNPNAPDELSNAIICLSESSERRNEIGKLASLKVENKFDIKNCITNLENIYKFKL